MGENVPSADLPESDFAGICEIPHVFPAYVQIPAGLGGVEDSFTWCGQLLFNHDLFYSRQGVDKREGLELNS